jgi:hypothetical protein
MRRIAPQDEGFLDFSKKGWFISRLSKGGAILGLGGVQASICPTRAGVKVAVAVLTFLGVEAALTLCGHPADPPELIRTWVALSVVRLTLS